MFVNYFLFFTVTILVFGSANCNNSIGVVPSNAQVKVSPTPLKVDWPTVTKTPALQIITSENIQCGGVEYDLQKVNNIDRQAYDIRLVTSDGTVTNILNMPSGNLIQNFGVDWAKKIFGGFEITVSWGTRIHHEKTFNFVCKQKSFVLTKIKHESFDTHFPEDSKKYQLSTKPVVPNLPLAKFVITDFLND